MFASKCALSSKPRGGGLKALVECPLKKELFCGFHMLNLIFDDQEKTIRILLDWEGNFMFFYLESNLIVNDKYCIIYIALRNIRLDFIYILKTNSNKNLTVQSLSLTLSISTACIFAIVTIYNVKEFATISSEMHFIFF